MPLAFLAVVGFVLVMLPVYWRTQPGRNLRRLRYKLQWAAPAPATHVTWEPVKTPKPWAQAWRLTIQWRRHLKAPPTINRLTGT